MTEQRKDFEFLRDFARHGEQVAFAELVRRHLNLVYATAWRRVQDEGAAQEVAQNVFTALARKAWQFAPDDSLPAWLYKTTLLESKEWLRGEMRRRRREQAAAELGTTMKNPAEQSALRALVPLLDEALLSLREKERTALLLRFYEDRPLRAVGASLGIGEDAAQKRVAGGLSKLAEFFQKRGFRTASVAGVAAVLESTASSAPASVVQGVLSAAAQLGPPAAIGIVGPAARLASLSKLQTAALCAAMTIVPLGWEWHGQRQARNQFANLQTQLEAAQAERSSVQVEIDRLQKSSTRLTSTLAGEADLAAQRSAAADRFSAWKNRLRALLTAGDYHWPDDSPFIRIPKSVVKRLETQHPVRPPGTLTQAGRELLGLTPEEREKVEAALQTHFAAMDRLIEDRVYETNGLSQIPSGALASKGWAIPALGEEVNTQTKALQASLQAALGPERYTLVEDQMGVIGTDTMRRVLNLDAAQNPQQVAVWISDFNGKPTVGYGWHGNSSAFSCDGVDLESFKAGAPDGARALPAALTARIMDWLQQQAATLPAKALDK